MALDCVSGFSENVAPHTIACLSVSLFEVLAFLGYASTWETTYRFPGCADFPGGHKAVLEIPPVDLLAPIFAICGVLELIVFKQKAGSFPGDMGGGAAPVGFGPLFTKGYDETEIRTKELLNGRAASKCRHWQERVVSGNGV